MWPTTTWPRSPPITDTISYTDANSLTVGTVTDTAMSPNTTTSGITSTGNDVKLTVLAGGLTIGDAVGPLGADDITLGAGTLTLNITGNVTQTSGNVITAAGLQLLGSGSVHLDEPGNNVGTIAASYSGPISYTDANSLTVGTVTDTAMSPSSTTSGISSNNNDVKLTVLAGGLTIGELTSTADDITLGSGNLTLNITGNVTQTSGNGITAAGLQLLGSGSVHLDEAGNNVATLAASYSGPISYTDASGLIVGTVTDTAMSPNSTTSGISSNNNDVKLTVLAGGLTIGDAVGPLGADDITLGAGNLTLNVTGNVTQTSGNVITAAGLQLLGTGSVHLDEPGNNVATLAANYSGSISYTDASGLIVGTVTDTAMSPNSTTSGISSNNNDVKLTVLAGGLTIGDAVGPLGADDITLGSGNLTLNVTGNVTQTSGNGITAAGLQLLGTGSVHLDEPGNNVATLAASYSGSISYTDANSLTVGTVTDTAMSPNSTSSGITSGGNDVKLTVLGGGLTIGDAAGP